MNSYVLCIDVGNSSIKFAISDSSGILESAMIATKVVHVDKELEGHFRELVQKSTKKTADLIDLKQCIVSSVVPAVNASITRACRTLFGLDPVFVHQDIEIPLKNEYVDPLEVGADRLVAAYAARKYYTNKSIVIIDYGTATTFDCMVESTYLGGLICPGIEASVQMLSQKAAKLPSLELPSTFKDFNIGTTTATSMVYGFCYSFIAMTEGLYERLCKMLPMPTYCVATGGFASAIAEHVTCFDVVHTDLVLEGLRLLWLEHYK